MKNSKVVPLREIEKNEASKVFIKTSKVGDLGTTPYMGLVTDFAMQSEPVKTSAPQLHNAIQAPIVSELIKANTTALFNVIQDTLDRILSELSDSDSDTVYYITGRVTYSLEKVLRDPIYYINIMEYLSKENPEYIDENMDTLCLEISNVLLGSVSSELISEFWCSKKYNEMEEILIQLTVYISGLIAQHIKSCITYIVKFMSSPSVSDFNKIKDTF